MSLATRCPQCNTLFRVTPAHLQAAAGKVRCGRCTHVFDGYAALKADPEAKDAVTERAAASPAAAGVQPTASAAAQSATQPATQPVTPAAPPVPPVAPQRPLIAARRFSPAARYAMWIGALVAVLTAQVAYAFRAEFIARSLSLRSTMESFCEFAKCAVPLPQRPDLLRIEASDVHMIDPSRPSLIQVTATVRSYAKHDLAYPALDLVLTNANEHALARRIFLPDEYVGAGRNPKAGIPPNAEVTVALDLETGDVNAAGFRLDLLAAPAK